jgi:hypothetical protein
MQLLQTPVMQATKDRADQEDSLVQSRTKECLVL